MTDKELALKIVDRQPDDCTFDDILRELMFHKMIRNGLKDVEAGRMISDEELGKEMETWRN